MKIDDEDMNEIIEDVHKRDNFNKEFDIGVVSKCEYDDDSSNNEEKSGDREWRVLTEFTGDYFFIVWVQFRSNWTPFFLNEIHKQKL